VCVYVRECVKVEIVSVGVMAGHEYKLSQNTHLLTHTSSHTHTHTHSTVQNVQGIMSMSAVSEVLMGALVPLLRLTPVYV
jgi:hypothetical protein